MTACTELLKREFPCIDDDIYKYVEGEETGGIIEE